MNLAGIFSKLDNVIVRVKDITLMKEWYEQVLGLKNVFFDENEKIAVYNVGNDITLSLWQLKTDENFVPACINGSFPMFFTDDIEGVHKSLKDKNVIIEDIHGSEFLKYFGFFDPEGNRMEAYQYFQ